MVIMNTEQNKKVEEILSSLDGSQRAVTPDFFYTRLKAKMLARLESGEKGLAKSNNQSWMLRPVYVVAGLLLILATNAMVLLKGLNQNQTNNITADNSETVQQSIAAEYSLNDSNAMYDLNQDK
jgi:hypothetical protein